MTSARILLVAAALSAAACGGPEPAADNAPAGPVAAEPAPGPAPDPIAAPAPNSTPPAEQASIPAAFHGVWTDGAAACADPAHYSRLVIAGTDLRFYDSAVTAASVATPDPRSIVVTGTATGEGTTRPAEYHFSIDVAGDTLIDQAGGGMVRTRCP